MCNYQFCKINYSHSLFLLWIIIYEQILAKSQSIEVDSFLLICYFVYYSINEGKIWLGNFISCLLICVLYNWLSFILWSNVFTLQVNDIVFLPNPFVHDMWYINYLSWKHSKVLKSKKYEAVKYHVFGVKTLLSYGCHARCFCTW